MLAGYLIHHEESRKRVLGQKVLKVAMSVKLVFNSFSSSTILVQLNVHHRTPRNVYTKPLIPIYSPNPNSARPIIHIKRGIALQ